MSGPAFTIPVNADDLHALAVTVAAIVADAVEADPEVDIFGGGTVKLHELAADGVLEWLADHLNPEPPKKLPKGRWGSWNTDSV